jgi:hypothetical protein
MKKFMDEWNKGYEKGYDDAMAMLKLTNENAEQALKEWEKTETFPVSSVEAHGFINGFKWAIRKAK